MNMRRVIASSLLVLLACGIGLLRPSSAPSTVAAAEDPHAYFNSLVRRNDHWLSYSLRDSQQLVSGKLGGFAQLQIGEPPSVTYDPLNDDDPHRQDAAKVVVAAFFDTAHLAQPTNASATTLTLDEAYRPSFGAGRVFRIDREVMTVAQWLSDTTISVKRGTHGSTAAAHAAGAQLQHSTNSLRSQVRLPLGTEDGHDYFFVWDAYWTDSYMGSGRFTHKAFQFSSGGRDGDTIFLEPQVSYAPNRSSCFDPSVHVSTFQVRSYNKVGGVANWASTDGNSVGPVVTNVQPVTPKQDYCIAANTWNRFFMHLRQRENDYDIVNLWVADERREPQQVLTNIPISVRPTGLNPNSITKFWIEFNSSEDELFRLDGRDLVSYVRNFVALRDVRDVSALLVPPVAGVMAPASGPAAPRNLRLFRR